ncbi:hypothetical protein [Janthinobacterium sp. PC23-8]|uniref:hypothetical protein n=1 Tax=Janthinobacterium sp. PC23-8 TaxID=2012679 RepID=UPI000B964819|nr:hypothetical protein [Janthinobacterium sp. PC23-8]OYO28046.1 hypothetical protein CD932_23425 [Janthinobacterium sp. PC23-8]
MAFHIFSGIPGRVVSVQVDDQGLFNVVGQGQAHELLVNLHYAQVHVAGAPAVRQAQRLPGIANGSRLEVILLNDQVRLQPRP